MPWNAICEERSMVRTTEEIQVGHLQIPHVFLGITSPKMPANPWVEKKKWLYLPTVLHGHHCNCFILTYESSEFSFSNLACNIITTLRVALKLRRQSHSSAGPWNQEGKLYLWSASKENKEDLKWCPSSPPFLYPSHLPSLPFLPSFFLPSFSFFYFFLSSCIQ